MNIYQKASVAVATLTLVVITFTLGFSSGAQLTKAGWEAYLISVDMAEYNTRTGAWQIRKMDDIVTSGIILGKGRETVWPATTK
jgi:hypothetical protein